MAASTVPPSTPSTPSGIDMDQLHAFAKALYLGDFSFRFAVTPGMSWKAEEIAVGLNRHLEQMGQLFPEIKRVCDEVGTQGKLGPQVEHTFGPGPWRDMVDSINDMATQLTEQLRDMNRTATLIGRGELGRPVTVDCQGETLELKSALNAIADGLRSSGPLA